MANGKKEKKSHNFKLLKSKKHRKVLLNEKYYHGNDDACEEFHDAKERLLGRWEPKLKTDPAVRHVTDGVRGIIH